MRRPTSLMVDTIASHELAYELDPSPRASIYSDDDVKHDYSDSLTTSTYEKPIPASPITNIAVNPPPPPSLRTLFSLIAPRRRFCLLFPAIISSLISGGIAPFMTVAIGQVFNAFATYPTSNPSQDAKDTLMHDVGIGSLELIGLAIGSLALGSLTSGLWISTGEHNVMNLRRHVYTAVTSKHMTWFDTKMGSEGAVQSVDNEQGPVGAGGLMAKFTRETDEVRMASSLASGRIIQYTTTCITCLVLAFSRSWALTLVILASVPALVLVQAFSQAVAGPLLAIERSQESVAATLIDRAVSAIATVKAFNAAAQEYASLSTVLDRVKVADKKLVAVWGLTSGLSQFVMMSMFVQAFWFGSKLVKQGKVAPGDVMAVFWACLIATSSLQMSIPQFITLTKGKFAMVSLLALADSSPEETGALSPVSPSYHCRASIFRGRTARSMHLRGIIPSKCHGEIALHNVTFAYPSRPSVLVLQDVSIYLPASETTFVVGGSGSGKSTISSLLLRLYKPQSGQIELDDQDVAYLDDNWTTEHISVVSQNCILFDMSVHDNVAMGLAGSESGRKPEDATRAEVEQACQAAMIHDFIRDLPDGYETKLGNGGANLSGGQKQRLAIARAQLRNPSVLILDEATSALDPTSRVLVFEAIKQWRENRTTIVITHDLSQITSKDFVYVLKNGTVIEQGYRADLERSEGEFKAMMDSQANAAVSTVDDEERTEKLGTTEDDEEDDLVSEESSQPFSYARTTLMPTIHNSAILGHWMFDVVADLTSKGSGPTPFRHAVVRSRESQRLSRFVPANAFTAQHAEQRRRRPSSVQVIPAFPPPPSQILTTHTRRYSLQFTPTSPTFSHHSVTSMLIKKDDSIVARRRSTGRSRVSRRRATLADMQELDPAVDIKVEKYSSFASEKGQGVSSDKERSHSFWGMMKDVYPTVPYKPLAAFGLIICLLSGTVTPIFSFVLSRLFFEVSNGAQNTSVINTFGAIVLSIAAIDGLLIGLKYFIMETCSMIWITRIRNVAFRTILKQDKKWFDKTENSAARIVQVLMKDGDDARTLIAIVIAQFVVVSAMLTVGFLWALVRGWQMTLAGCAIAPVFAGAMALQAKLVANCELRNKRAREDVSKGYYEAITNIRGIRAMAFESVFRRSFDNAAERALSTGVKGAFVEGCTHGVASGLIYLAEALLFYVGAVLIVKDIYTYLQMLEVLNMVVFTVSIGSQLMAFTEKIAKATNATRDFNQLLNLSTDTDESRGILRPSLNGTVSFNNVSFAYPERPDALVLEGINMEIRDGECVAIVGASGSGKSTIAALLQRLYEPKSGTIWAGLDELRSTDVEYLREHISVVSQNPNLFDATISENIAYGNKSLSDHDTRVAARAAHVHDFIMSLPHGYETMVGENASLISGGQAQRLQIARALARPSKILILDECTSSLDPANQAAVLETIRHAKIGRTTVMVTHKLPVMKTCDRILVIDDGKIAEQGTFEQLMERKGVFASLVSGGGIVCE
ncbi:P-loop containing nucleoside triphosphate hydrolase protein [Guyanagaster necrorhizus]|uniref:P-loop containing nucleoside triphosphate hydrolase protein n=1 Tax=Guyanagaster necrorhizus TaxID=856835 RepID=A0A9P7VZQ4_9AGAR|nr:P-loop containing nucleoside triphosphate hydrolase protein [Guyanagaster necrorhizus MCA 3950]KAG7449558.1 P-loop containing nucleoside triphosphate hydrolase protein [Guyanagaster necrorhizus MCA 3950]